ncbi:MAG: 2OG-Fe(II) oxygenase [Proteobacteria bacterium]|nr:2OG-Fe(II) oxygenase [Pseudomonadota bacterium]
MGYYPKNQCLLAIEHFIFLQGIPMAETDSLIQNDNETETAFDLIAKALEIKGYIVLAEGLPIKLGEALHRRILSFSGEFKRAGIGRGQALTQDDSIRTDCLRWLRPDNLAETDYLAWMEQLRLALNRRLFLGLFDYESHFAVYEAGGCYRKHLDAFHGETNRVLSTVYYLNPHWLPSHCGELLIHAPTGDTLLQSVTPAFGTMAIFLSALFPHEVAVTRRKRYSIAGWFRGR